MNILEIVRTAMSAKKQLGDELDRLSDEIARLRVQRQALHEMPAPREDVKRAVLAHLAQLGKPFTDDFSRRMLLLAREPHLIAGNSPALSNLIGLVGAGSDSNDAARARAVDSMVVALLGEYLSVHLTTVIDALRYEEGLPLSVRAAEIDKIDARIAEAEAAFLELRAEADRAGITF